MGFRKVTSVLLTVCLFVTMFSVGAISASASSLLDKEMIASMYNVKTDGTAKGDGKTDDASAIKNAITAAGKQGKYSLYFPAGTYYVNSSLTIANSVELVFEQGAIMKVSSSGKLKLYGNIVAGNYQIFDIKGTISGYNGTAVGNPVWFGAKGDGKTDDSVAIQQAINVFYHVDFPASSKGYVLKDVTVKRSCLITGDSRNSKVKLIAASNAETLFTFQASYIDFFSFDIEMKNAPSAIAFYFNTKSMGSEQNHFADIDVYNAKTVVSDQGTQMMITTEFLNFNCYKGTGTAFLCNNMWGFIFLTKVKIDYSQSTKMDYPAIIIKNNAGMVLTEVDIIGSSDSTANARGVYTIESQAMWFQHVRVKNVGGTAFQNDGRVNWHIYYYDCHAENVGGYGFEMLDKSSWLQYAHCSVTKAKGGFVLIGQGVQITDSSVSEVTGNAITATCKNSVFTDLELNNNGGYGIVSTGKACTYINITGSGNASGLTNISGNGSNITTY